MSDGRTVVIASVDAPAAAHYERLRRRVRVADMDLRIACIALGRDELLVTANARDFAKVPGLRFEDRTRPT